MKNFLRTLKIGFIPAVIIGLFIKTIATTTTEIYALLPTSHKWLWVLALAKLFLGLIYVCGRGTSKITLVLGMFFKNLGAEAIYDLNWGERRHRMIAVGEIVYGATDNKMGERVGGITYCVCYRASFLRLMVDAPVEIKKTKLIFTGRSAAEALFSSAVFMSDLINKNKKAEGNQK